VGHEKSDRVVLIEIMQQIHNVGMINKNKQTFGTKFTAEGHAVFRIPCRRPQLMFINYNKDFKH